MTLWDVKSSFYSTVRSFGPIRWVLRREIANLKDLLASSEVAPEFILDLGSGSGDSLSLYDEADRMICLDNSLSMLHQCGKRFPAASLVAASAQALPFHSGRFAFLSVIGLLEYIGNEGRFLFDCFRITVPGAALLLTNARPGLLNRLRRLLGHPVTTRPLDKILASADRAGWRLLDRRQSLLQDQCLFIRKNNRQEME